MAKIASSKPYGSGKAKTPTKPTTKKEIEVTSPVRTSPRRRKSIAPEETAVQLEEAKKTMKEKKPAPPKFSESKKKTTEASPKKPKSPKTPGRGRRKSALEPVILESETAEKDNETEGIVESYQISVNSSEKSADEIDEIFKPVDSNHFGTEEEQDEEYLEDYVEAVYQQEREESSASTSIYEEDNSPILGNNVQEDEEYFVDEQETTPSDEEMAFHFDEEEIESSEGSNSEALDEEIYNEQQDQLRYNSSTVRLRLAQYFQRQESALNTASSLKNQLWTKMKEWVSVNVIPSAKELGEVTVEYTKKAIETISKRLEKRAEQDEANAEAEMVDDDVSVYEDEPRIYEITDDQEGDYEDEMEVDLEEDIEMDHKKAKLMEEPVDNCEHEEFEEQEQDRDISHTAYEPSSLQSSYHSVPAAIDETLIMESQTPQKQNLENYPVRTTSSSDAVYNEVMDSRLTEIVLFFAKCTGDTPISSIYEHLEEFFTLKGENSLNFTEKQLVSSVIKDFLTEKDEQLANLLPPPVPVYEPVVPVDSPKRIKVLSGGIRFRAPKFTAEEEARLEEMEKLRQKNMATAANRISTLSTPQQRSKIQRKLLAPEMTAEFIERLPENRGKASSIKNKADSVSSAIEDIISQKIKETKKREEAERLETEKLKARVAELERESRERATKEALLQKQLEEQKKELEIEKAAAKEKLESLKSAASATKPSFNTNFSFGKTAEQSEISVPKAPIAASPGFSFGKIGDEKPPVASVGFNFGETTVGAVNAEKEKDSASPAFKGFSFGAVNAEKEKDAANPFAAFSFGKSKTESKESSEKSILNPDAPAFNFGGSVKKENEEKAEIKPADSFVFTFGNSTAGAGEEKKPETEKETSAPVFSFGAAKPAVNNAAAGSETKSTFSFGMSADKPAVESKPTSTFSFGSMTTTEKPATSASTFSFGSAAADKPATTSAFSFGGASEKKETTTTAPSFNFGAKAADKPSGSVFNFGASDKEAKPFGSTATNNSGTSSAFGNAEPAKSSGFGSSAFNFGSSSNLPSAPSTNNSNNANNPFAALNSATNIFSSAPPVNSGFSFGASSAFPPVPSANAFSFPPISPSTGNAPIIPMNFGGSQPGATADQSADMAFQTGSTRAISIPKRRRK